MPPRSKKSERKIYCWEKKRKDKEIRTLPSFQLLKIRVVTSLWEQSGFWRSKDDQKKKKKKRWKKEQKSNYFFLKNQHFHPDKTKPHEATPKPKQYGSPVLPCGWGTKKPIIYTVRQAWAPVIKHWLNSKHILMAHTEWCQQPCYTKARGRFLLPMLSSTGCYTNTGVSLSLCFIPAALLTALPSENWNKHLWQLIKL